MGGVRMNYDASVTEAEQKTLHERRDTFLNGYGNQPLFWEAITVGKERYFRVFTSESRHTCVAMIPAAVALTKEPSLLRTDIASGREFLPFEVQ